MPEMRFAGFPEETFAFLAGLSAHNDKAWFEDHRADYDAFYVGVARDFVSVIGPKLTAVSPEVRHDAKVNGSISRINRDVRFSKDKRPYKDHLDLWFWHGDKRSWECPGFYLRLTAETVFLGVGLLGFSKPMLARYRELISNEKRAAEIHAILEDVAASGPYGIGGRTRKAPPRGMPTEGMSGEMLHYEALSATLEWDNGIARSPEFVSFCLGHWQKCWPIGKWTLENVWR